MISVLKNEELIVSMSACGAEVQSIKDAKSGKEYLWQGDAAFWSGRSPILFPNVGACWKGEARIGEHVYQMPKHGFTIGKTFQLVEESTDTLCYRYEETEDTLKVFPFRFTLNIYYHLSGRELKVSMEVVNKGNETMPFHLGGHPGFILPDFSADDEIKGFIQLDNSSVDTLPRAGYLGCLEHERYTSPVDEKGRIALKNELFKSDALIFDHDTVHRVTLLDKQERAWVQVDFGAPVLLLWRPYDNAAPFLCVEPWYGLCDEQEYNGLYTDRPYTNHVEAGERWEGFYAITILEK